MSLFSPFSDVCWPIWWRSSSVLHPAHLKQIITVNLKEICNYCYITLPSTFKQTIHQIPKDDLWFEYYHKICLTCRRPSQTYNKRANKKALVVTKGYTLQPYHNHAILINQTGQSVHLKYFARIQYLPNMRNCRCYLFLIFWIWFCGVTPHWECTFVRRAFLLSTSLLLSEECSDEIRTRGTNTLR